MRGSAGIGRNVTPHPGAQTIADPLPRGEGFETAKQENRPFSLPSEYQRQWRPLAPKGLTDKSPWQRHGLGNKRDRSPEGAIQSNRTR
jgi:hypothetical protein